MARKSVERRSMESVPSERAVLGAVLATPSLVHDMGVSFRPELFTLPVHKQIATAIKKLDDNGRAVTLSAVLNLLPPESDSDDPFSPEGYLSTLVYDQAAPGVAGDLLSDINAMYGRRRIMAAGKSMIDKSMVDDGRDPVDLLESIFEDVRNDISSGAVTSIPISVALDKAMTVSNERAMGRAAGGLPWFMDELNPVLGLQEPGHLIGILADAKAGKTSFGLRCAWHASLTGPSLFFSMEMKHWIVAMRLLSQISRVPEEAIANGKYSDDELDAVMEAKAKLAKLPLEIIDRSRMTVAQMRAKAMEIKRRYGALAWCGIDHLKVIKAERHFQKDTEAIGENMIQAKSMASDLECPTQILMQRTRSSFDRRNPRPTADDAYGGGATLENVDILVGVWRKEKWLEEHPPADDEFDRVKAAWQADLQAHKDKAEIIGLARRFGKSSGSLMCRFEGQYGLYSPLNTVSQGQIMSMGWQ